MQKQLSLFEEEQVENVSDQTQPAFESNSINEFFQRYFFEKGITEFQKFLNIISENKNYSLYNNMLVYLQDPDSTYFATAADWRKKFGRLINMNAKPLIILAPMTPVLLVYDIADTHQDENSLIEFESEENKQEQSESFFENLLFNLSVLKIDLIFLSGQKISEFPEQIKIERTENFAKKIYIFEKREISIEDAQRSILNKIASLYLGFYGEVERLKIISREEINEKIKEIENNAVIYLFEKRIAYKSVNQNNYSSSEFENENLKNLNYDLIIKTAAFLEKICKKRLSAKID